MGSLRVAFLVGNTPGVSETWIWNQIRALQKLDVQIELFAFSKTPREKAEIESRYSIVFHPLRPIPRAPLKRAIAAGSELRKTLQASRRCELLHSINPGRFGRTGLTLAPLHYLRPLFEGRPPDILHCHFGMQGRFGAIARMLGLSSKLVTTFHGIDYQLIPTQKSNHYYRQLFQEGDLFTTNSNYSYQRIIDLGCPPEKLHILPMGTDPEQFFVRPRSFDPNRALRILTVARLVEFKGIPLALKALAHFKESNPRIPFHYRIIGGGPLFSDLTRQIEELNLTNEVELTGPLPHEQVQEHYRWTDLFLLPGIITSEGRAEAQGVVIQEAQAAGIPVLVSDAGGAPEGVLHGETGYVFRAGDSESLRLAIQWMLDHQDHWPRFGQAGRALVEEKFSLPKSASQLLELYRKLL